LKLIVGPSGAWKFVELDEVTLALGTYIGVTILKKQANEWVPISTIPGLQESSRIMIFDKDKNLWISHPYKKLYKVNFNKDFTNSNLKIYNAESGFKTDKRNYVFNVLGECIVTNEKGVFQYNSKTDGFSESKMITDVYPPGIHLKRIIYSAGQYWAISDNGTDILNFDTTTAIPRLFIDRIGSKANNGDYIGGFEQLYPINNNSFMQCTDSGVKLINANSISDKLDKPILTSVHLPASGDSTIYGGYGKTKKIELEDNISAIRFELSSSTKNSFGHYFMYYLEGLDEKWSEWTKMTTKEYTNLSHGNYTFHAKSVNIYNRESAPTSINFSIATPWYKSKVARTIFLSLILLSLLCLLLIPRKIYKDNTALLESEKKKTEEEMIKVKEETEAEMQRVKRDAEAELERMNREKLENEILFKNKELAMSTMNLLQKNETLTAIRTEVEKAEKNIKDPQAKKEVKKIISLLRTDERLEDDWNNFSIHFDQAHHQFLKRLKSEYPQLTPKDQKLCAYLRMNLTTKEIAPLLKISVRGVEISRYRLRKKIGLKKEVNLNDFMMNF